MNTHNKLKSLSIHSINPSITISLPPNLKRLNLNASLKSDTTILPNPPNSFHFFPFAKYTLTTNLQNVRSLGINENALDLLKYPFNKLHHLFIRNSNPSKVFDKRIKIPDKIISIHTNGIEIVSLHKQIQFITFTSLQKSYMFDEFVECPNLITLNLTKCKELRNLNNIHLCKNLKYIRIEECPMLNNINGLMGCTKLIELEILWKESPNKLDVQRKKKENQMKTHVKAIIRDIAEAYEDKDNERRSYYSYDRELEKVINIRNVTKNMLIEMTNKSNIDTSNFDTSDSDDENPIYIPNNKLSSLAGLKYCTELQKLTVTGSMIQNVDALSACIHLWSIDLSQSFCLDDINGIAKCTKLRDICLRDCTKVWDLNPLNTCHDLRDCDLSGCKNIFTIKPLETCTKLQTIHLNGTSVDGDEKLILNELRFINLHDCFASFSHCRPDVIILE